MDFLQANLDYLVLGTLGFMSFVMLALVVERYLYLNRVDIKQFAHLELLKVGGKIEVHTIMLGLAMALKATAAGLVVAIPAILFYNGLLRKVEVLTAQWQAWVDGKAA